MFWRNTSNIFEFKEPLWQLACCEHPQIPMLDHSISNQITELTQQKKASTSSAMLICNILTGINKSLKVLMYVYMDFRYSPAYYGKVIFIKNDNERNLH